IVTVDAVVSTREGDTITIGTGAEAEVRVVTKVVGKELQFTAALEHAHIVDVVVVTTLELFAEALAGASTFKVNESFADNSWVRVSGTETVHALDVDEVKPGEWEVELASPLKLTHAAKAAVTGLTA